RARRRPRTLPRTRAAGDAVPAGGRDAGGGGRRGHGVRAAEVKTHGGRRTLSARRRWRGRAGRTGRRVAVVSGPPVRVHGPAAPGGPWRQPRGVRPGGPGEGRALRREAVPRPAR